MKKLLILYILMVPFFSKAQNIKQLWTEIESNMHNYDIALPKINEALDLARKENDYPLEIKAKFYKAKIEMNTDENYDMSAFIRDFQEADQSTDLNASLHQIYLAKLYESYWSSHQYKISGRTPTSGKRSEDMAFWTKEDFHSVINEFYLKALSYKHSLLKESISKWQTIRYMSPEIGDNYLIESLTPTLFHFYTHLYIHSTVISSVEKERLLADLESINSDNKYFSSYLYFKKLEIHNGENYVDNLEELVKKYPQDWYTAELYKFLAQQYHLQATTEKSKDKFVKVFEIRDLVKQNYPNSEALKELNNRVEQIHQKRFQIGLPELLAPLSNTPIHITHTNVDKLFIKILDYNVGTADIDFSKVRKALNINYKDSEEQYQTFLKSHKTVSNYEIPLKAFDDFLEHNSIYNFKKLDRGRYVVLFSTDEKFELAHIQYLEIQVSDHAISSDNKGTILVNNIVTGKPISKLKLQVHEGRSFQNKQVIITNDKGLVQYDTYGSYYVDNENVFFKLENYSARNPVKINEVAQNSTEIFTDRSIYKPGQTVYFKAIVKNSLDRKIEVLRNYPVKISLQNTNGQIVKDLQLTTNDMGSVSGQFIIPNNTPTGNFSIVSNQTGYRSIQVEEYKRPEFFIKLEKPEKSYILNDTVQVTGFAESFAGAKIVKAKVNYAVYRELPRWWRVWNIEPDKQIAFGETYTDQNGKFDVQFIAIPENGTLYTYRIEANVTDQNGETQSGEVNISVGKTPLLVNIELPNKSNVDNLKEIHIRLQNLNQKSVIGKGKIKISRLKSPEDLIISNLYIVSYDYFSKGEFKSLFGNLSYGNELDPTTWDVDKVVFEGDFVGEKLSFPHANTLTGGHYKIEIQATDGKYTTENTQIVLLENKFKPHPSTELFTYGLNQEEYKVGDEVKLQLKTAADVLYLYLRTEVNSDLVNDEIIELKKGDKTLNFSITEKHLGGFFIHYRFVKNNREYKGSISIAVPYTHKKIKIETEVVKDLMSPGQKEKWKLKISGDGLMEGLASMYDNSLDQFLPHTLNYFAYNFYNSPTKSFGYRNFNVEQNTWVRGHGAVNSKMYIPSQLNLFGLQNSVRSQRMRDSNIAMSAKSGSVESEILESAPAMEDAISLPPVTAEKLDLSQVYARNNLQETAFFYPHVFVEKDGTISLEFDAPESLTQWKFMFFAHTPDLKTGYFEHLVKTQKELMVTPNLPRFFREKDQLEISVKIDNLTEELLKGEARIIFLDPITEKVLDQQFLKENAQKTFTAEQSTSVSWNVTVPENLSFVKYKILAKAGNFSDGVEGVLSIVSNRMLVTETLPIFIKENQSKKFVFEKLQQHSSNTLVSKKLTLEFTANPIWYAVFSLPHLKQGSDQFTDAIFAKIYASAVGAKILNDNPKIKTVFDQWNKEGLTASSLKRNQELKNILLEETPWLNADENQIAALFEVNQMRSEVENNFRKLKEMQNPSGAFSWYKGGSDNQFVTQNVVAGFGMMKNMGVSLDNQEMIEKAIQFLDNKQFEFYEEQQKLKKPVYGVDVNYLYTRSFYLKEFPIDRKLKPLVQMYVKALKSNSEVFSNRVLSALVLSKYGEKKEAEKKLKSLKSSAVKSDEMGMYWKQNTNSWTQVAVVNHSHAIEAFDDILNDSDTVEAMKVWLLKQRQGQSWSSSLSTIKAVYVLLNTGKNWTHTHEGVELKVADHTLKIPSSGYLKKEWTDINSELGKVSINKTSAGPAWGAMYWQYLEDLDKITPSETGISFNKKIYKKSSNTEGEILEEISTQNPIKVGDILTVRLEISSDRDIQFVHIKDMRAAGLEPLNVLSSHKYQEGLSYFESTRDAATHFFVDQLRKGKYVFIYDLKANISGIYSNGITQIQSAFAPEFNASSKGDKILIMK